MLFVIIVIANENQLYQQIAAMAFVDNIFLFRLGQRACLEPRTYILIRKMYNIVLPITI